ncbi:MAG: N-acetylglucosamine kinase [Flavobacterium sp.]
MKLIVDSGSTKADWIAIDNSGTVIFTTQTLGLNPEILVEESILSRINDRFDISYNKDKVTYLFFYGAGCGTDRMKVFLAEVLQKYFPNAEVNVHEDTYAAIYATCGLDEKAIVSILGTGSNCSYYDGKEVHQKVQSLGYIAMDDCSGNFFGRQIIRSYYFNKMPAELASILEKQYDLDADSIKNNLYKEANPNAYLATYAKFLIENKNHPYLQNLILENIESFLENYIKQYDNYRDVALHFVGSIAFYLKDELEVVLQRHNLTLGQVFRRPIDGLIRHHIENV